MSPNVSIAQNAKSAGRGHPLRKARKKFLAYFPGGFRDSDFVGSERNYKYRAHLAWREALNRRAFRQLIGAKAFDEIASTALRIESRTNLIFSYEKMALRDAVRDDGAARFSTGLFEFLHGGGQLEDRFSAWVDVLESLPRPKSRVLTWPVATVFGFLAKPKEHLFIKPTVMKTAASKLDLPFAYKPRPNWNTYESALELATNVASGVADLGPRDMIDLQSFLWVQGSEEYPD